MKKISNYLNDLEKIEKILLKCYGKNGQSALIQSSSNSESESNTYILTNDGMTILNTLRLENNQLYNLITKLIKKFSLTDSDNIKTFYIYILTSLKYLFDSITISNSNFKSQEEIDLIKTSLRFLNLNSLFDLILNEWKTNKICSDHFILIKTKSQFLNNFTKLCVFDDLNNFNSNLSTISKELIINLIKYNLESAEIKFDQIPNILKNLLNNLDDILFYSDRSDLNETKLYKNGFLLENKLNLNFIDKSTRIKSIFLLKQSDIINNDINIDVKSNLNSRIAQILESDVNNRFSDNFIEQLKINEIKLIFYEGHLNDIKKSQLNLIKCSLVNYLTKEKIDYLTFKLNKQPVDSDVINFDKNVFIIESIERIKESEMLNYFKLTETSCLASILFCSSLKANLINFKILFLKCLKILLNSFDTTYLNNDYLIFLKCFHFELNSIKIFTKLLENSNQVDLNMLNMYKYLKNLFLNLIFKFQNFKTIKEFHNFDLNFNQYYNSYFNSINVYEPLSIKIKCLFQSIVFVQSLLKIDSICFVNKSIRSIKSNDSDQDDDDDDD